MDVTGERFLPELDWPEISYEHWHRYLWAARLVAGRRVLDVGCGEGYGSSVLAASAREVLAIDPDGPTVGAAAAKYRLPNLTFRAGSAEALPVADAASFDAVVGFEMIEHLTAEGQQAFLAEVRRVLHSEGLFVVSTPDKRLYSDATGYANAFHLHELYVDEFVALLGGAFKHVYLLGQRVFPTSHIWPLEPGAAGVEELQLHYSNGHFAPGSDDKKAAIFVIAICSDAPVAPERLSLLLDVSGQVTFRTNYALADQEQLIIKQRDDVLELQGMVAARDEQLAKDAADIARLQELITAREEQLAKDAADILDLQQLVAARDEQLAKDAADIARLQELVTAREEQLAKDAQDIAQLQGQLAVSNEQLAKDAQDIAQLQAQVVALEEQRAKSAIDIVQLQGAVVERDEQIATQAAQLAKDGQDIAMLQGMVVERDVQLAKDAQDIAALLTELEAFKGSLGGRALMRLWRLRQRVLPAGSVLERGGRLAWRSARMLRHEGPGATMRYGVGWLRYQREQRRGGATAQPSNGTVPPPTPAEEQDAYRAWQAAFEPRARDLDHQREQVARFAEQPLVSLVLLLDGATAAEVRATLGSLMAQTYGCWECWLVTSSVVEEVLHAAIAPVVGGDERVRVLAVAEKTPEAQYNQVLSHLDGAWVAVVNAGDQLAPAALFAAIALVNERPAVDLVYADSDRLDRSGRRVEPWFKPDWSPALLLSLNLLGGLALVRAELLRAVGGANGESGSSWQWDLALRLSERTSAIAHLPQVLYHRAGTPFEAEGLTADGKAAVLRHLARQGIDAEVVPNSQALQLRWQRQTEPLVSIIIPSRNVEMVGRCLHSIQEHTGYRNYELIVVDTSSNGAIAARYGADPQLPVQVLRYTEPFNYSLVNNLAARKANGDLLLFLNDDIEAFTADWLDEMVRWALRERVGVVGGRLLRADGSLQHAGVVIGLGGFAGHPFDGGPADGRTIFGSPLWYRNYSAVTGACLLIRHTLFKKVGGFDESMILCGSDVELCLRAIDESYAVVYTPFAQLYHLESATRGGSAIPPMDFAFSYACYLPLLKGGDPFFNPNLSSWSTLPQFRRTDEMATLDHVRASLRQLGVVHQAEALLRERGR